MLISKNSQLLIDKRLPRSQWLLRTTYKVCGFCNDFGSLKLKFRLIGAYVKNASKNMELRPLDLFPFLSKILSAKCPQIAQLVSFVYVAAVAKLKPKSLTIESISVEKLEELVSHSHYKFDYVGDLQACALLSINTLITLSASNKSWLRITKLKSDFQGEKNFTESSRKPQWKILMPPVKTKENDSSKNYVIQCLCISNAPRDFVLYVSDVKLFNILKHWKESESFYGATGKVQVECTAESNFPSIAKSAVFSAVLTGDDVNAKDLEDILAEYFTTLRLLKPGELIHINLLKFGSQFQRRSSLWSLLDVYFKVVTIKGESNWQEYYILKGYTDIYLNPPVHSCLPPKKLQFIKTVSEIPGFEISRCPGGLINYFNKLTKVLKLLIKKRNIDGMILLTGAKGSGKKTTVKAVSAAFGLNFVRASCFEFYGKNSSVAHTKLAQICGKARIAAPCILYFENVELLGREQNYSENPRLIDLFETQMKELHVRKSSSYPLIVVGSTESGASDVVPAIARLFIHVVPFKAPTPDETYLSMKWFLKYTNMILPPNDLKKVVEKIRGYVFADLILLIQQAVHIQSRDSSLDEGCRRVLHLEHFNQAIDIMESAYSDSIGAARVPKVHWEDIGGLGELKEEIMLTLNLPIQHPELFTSGLKRSGILFYGPPGTGKTLMAKAVATECSYNFLSVKGPELMNMYVGQSEKNVREVFERAREASPCVIFFDELDSLAPSRGKSGDSGGVSDRVVSQLLAEMDGLDKNKEVFIIAATNRPDLIDSALLRPGRFDKMFYVGVCKDKDSKLSVLKALTRRFNLGKDVDLEKMVTSLSYQVTGADLYSVCSNAWFSAARRAVNSIENGTPVSLPLEVSSEDFSEAISQFVPSLTAQDIDYYEKLKSS